MVDLCETFGVQEKERFHIIDDGRDAGLFYIEKNTLFDARDQIDDTELGRLLRQKASIRKDMLQHAGKYWYFDTDGSVKSRKNQKSWLDIINARTGNAFLSKEEMSDAEKNRIAAVYESLVNGSGMAEDKKDELEGLLASTFKKSLD